MPLLAFHVDPSCEDGRFVAMTDGTSSVQVGDCVHVWRDGESLSDLERKHYVVVRTDKPYEDCVAAWLASGVPDDVRAALDAAFDALTAAKTALEKAPPPDPKSLVVSPEQAAFDAAKATYEAVKFHPLDYPRRRVKIDVSRLPRDAVQAVAAFKAAVDAVRPQGYEAKAAAVAATIEALGISPSKAAKILNPDPSVAVDLAGVASDAQVEEIRSNEAAAWALVVEPVERSFAPLDVVEIDAKTLDDMLIDKTAVKLGGPSPAVEVAP